MALAPSSPRLPSPPPPAEIQIGPKSPAGGATANLQTTPMEQSLLDANSRRRIHPGTKAADMAAGPPLIPLSELDSAFQLQEHLAALHFHHTAHGTEPVTRTTAVQLAQPPPGIDRTLWLYELCRFLISQCNSLIVGFLFDAPPCSASTCPEMRASEWQFLCAVHDQPKSCCAIDYCCHTLDWAANVVTDQNIFPSRFVVLNDPQSKNVGVKNLVNVFRRLHRVFAHAWFQHRSVFWAVEGETGLYVFFKTVCDLYDLLPAENYKLPPEAEGIETQSSQPEAEKPPQILKPTSHQQAPPQPTPLQRGGGDEEGLQPTRTNTRRHIRSSPSTGSAVTTVIEAEEEDGESMARRMKDMHISAPETVQEEPEVAEVPVIVEQSVIEDASPKDPIAASQPSSADRGDEIDFSDDISDADQTVIEADDTISTEDLTTGPNVQEVSEAPQEIPEPTATEEKVGDESEQPTATSDATAVVSAPVASESATETPEPDNSVPEPPQAAAPAADGAEDDAKP